HDGQANGVIAASGLRRGDAGGGAGRRRGYEARQRGRSWPRSRRRSRWRVRASAAKMKSDDGIKEAVVWDDRMPPLIWNWGPGRGVRSMAVLTHARATATSPYLAVKGANAKDATSAALAPSFTRANGVTVRPDYVAPQERGAQPT